MKLTVPIFCSGLRTHARFDAVLGFWKCARCGSKVKVVT